MLYYPWYDETADLLGGYETYEEHYRHVKSIVLENENKYTQSDVEDVDIYEVAHLNTWNQIAPSTEDSRLLALSEGSETLMEVSQEDLQDNANMYTAPNSALNVRFDSSARKQEILAYQYRQMLRELNTKPLVSS